MRLKANDTLHVSAAGPENIAPGAEFEVSDDQGADLVERGLATEVVPENKMIAAPMNKASFKGKGK